MSGITRWHVDQYPPITAHSAPDDSPGPSPTRTTLIRGWKCGIKQRPPIIVISILLAPPSLLLLFFSLLITTLIYSDIHYTLFSFFLSFSHCLVFLPPLPFNTHSLLDSLVGPDIPSICFEKPFKSFAFRLLPSCLDLTSFETHFKFTPSFASCTLSCASRCPFPEPIHLTKTTFKSP